MLEILKHRIIANYKVKLEEILILQAQIEFVN